MMVDDQSLGGMSELTPSVQPYGNTFDDGDESSSDDGGDAGDLAAPLPSMTMRGRRASAEAAGGRWADFEAGVPALPRVSDRPPR